jgi:hypothetical protein
MSSKERRQHDKVEKKTDGYHGECIRVNADKGEDGQKRPGLRRFFPREETGKPVLEDKRNANSREGSSPWMSVHEAGEK